MNQHPDLELRFRKVPGKGFSDKSRRPGDEDFLHAPHYSTRTFFSSGARRAVILNPFFAGINLALLGSVLK
jgi:hypothetical protein